MCFLKLADELVSDAMPIVGIAPGMKVEDLAGTLPTVGSWGL